MSEQNILKPVKSFEITDEFIMHGNTALVEKSLGLDTESLTDAIFKRFRTREMKEKTPTPM
ncbi:1-deoxy-D-xylulose-5-phosphate synthase, partial [Rhodococcus opacus PD630]